MAVHVLKGEMLKVERQFSTMAADVSEKNEQIQSISSERNILKEKVCSLEMEVQEHNQVNMSLTENLKSWVVIIEQLRKEKTILEEEIEESKKQLANESAVFKESDRVHKQLKEELQLTKT